MPNTIQNTRSGLNPHKSVPPRVEEAIRVINGMARRSENVGVAKELREASLRLLQTGLPNLSKLLPLFFNLKGEPYTLENHYPFEPFFHTLVARKAVWKTARQVSKSTSQASQGTLNSICVPYFNTLYVTPLYEMIRRFSNNYVKGFIDQSPIKSMFTGTSTSSNVLQRSFLNGSNMFFSFAFLDADRTRGLNNDKVCYDETPLPGYVGVTHSGGEKGYKWLTCLRPGDMLDSYGTDGRLCSKQMLSIRSPGKRACFRITTKRGHYVAATEESWIATPAGWRRLIDIAKACLAYQSSSDVRHFQKEVSDATIPSDASSFDGTTRTVDYRNDVGRRLFSATECLPVVPVEPRLDSARIQLGKAPSLIRVRKYSTREEEEWRLRQMVEPILDATGTGVQILVSPMLPEWQKAGEQGVAEAADLGRSSLVDRRRRQFGWDQDVAEHGVPHGRIFEIGSPTLSYLAPSPRRGMQNGQSDESPRYGTGLLDDSLYGRRYAQIAERDETIRSSGDVVQMGIQTSGRSSLLLLPDEIQADRQHGEESGFGTQTLLREAGVSQATEEHAQQRVRVAEPGNDQPEVIREVLRRSRKEQGISSTESSGMDRSESGRPQCPTPNAEGGCGCSQASATDRLRVLQNDIRNKGGSPHPLLFAGMQKEGTERNGTAIRPETEDGSRLVADDVATIEFVGYHDVYDLEIEDTETFIINGVAVHNCQDMDSTFIPIIRETMSGSRWALEQFTGTPKTLDNTIEGLWLQSSQAQWVVPCPRCHYDNYACLSHDLDEMTGPYHHDISEARPGVICAKCKRPLNPRGGMWHHKYPQKIPDFSGYHVPQLIMPMHFADRDKWRLMLEKRQGMFNTSVDVYHNEVCGESSESGAKLVTITDLKNACCLWKNDEEEGVKHLSEYTHRVVGIDWGGGGVDGVSFTCYSVLGIRADGRVDCIYGYRSLTPHDFVAEAKFALYLVNKFRCQFIAHDYTGAGAYREQFIIQAGFPYERVIPVWYVRAGSQQLMRYVQGTVQHPRDHYKLDKARSLVLVCQQIKNGNIRFFQYDGENPAQNGLVDDFLALVEEKVDSRTGRDIYTIIKQQNMTDDFAQSVNIGACTLWYTSGQWPNVAETDKFRVSDELLKAISPEFGMGQLLDD